jgi:hypothetical protein
LNLPKIRNWLKNGEAVRVTAPEIGEDVVLLRAGVFEVMRRLAEDEREQKAVLIYSMKQAAQAARENPF